MNNLTKSSLVGLVVGGKFVKCLVIVGISMEFGGAKRCGEGFKVILFRWMTGGGSKPQMGDQFYEESYALCTP